VGNTVSPRAFTSQTPMSELGRQCDLIETVPRNTGPSEALPQRPLLISPVSNGAKRPAALARGGVFLWPSRNSQSVSAPDIYPVMR
jgi:hypothetical protein